MIIRILIIIILLISSVKGMADIIDDNDFNDNLTERIKANAEINNDLILNVNKNIDEKSFLLYDLLRKNKLAELDKLLADYQNTKGHDKNLVNYILAKKAEFQGDYKSAIDIYMAMLNESGYSTIIYMDIAGAYLKDKNDMQALNIYQRILDVSQGRLPFQLVSNISGRIRAIKQRYYWKGNIMIGTTYDSNIYLAPEDERKICNKKGICMVTSDELKSATSFNYALDMSKRYPIYGHHHANLSFVYKGIDYHHRVQKNKQSLTAYSGYRYDKNKFKFNLTTINDLQISHGQYHHYGIGIKTGVELSITPRWLLLLNGQTQKYYHRAKYAFHNGVESSYTLNNVYFITPRTVAILRGNGVHREKLFKSDSYDSYGLQFGITTIQPNIELRGRIGYKQTQFKQYDSSINTQRKDKNWYLNSEMTLPTKSVFKFIPTIYFNYQVNNSTADVVYSFRQSEVGVSVTRQF